MPAAPPAASADSPAVTLPLTVTADAAGRVTVDLGPDHAGERVQVSPTWRYDDGLTDEQRRARLEANAIKPPGWDDLTQAEWAARVLAFAGSCPGMVEPPDPPPEDPFDFVPNPVPNPPPDSDA